jgi:hypothetical protein
MASNRNKLKLRTQIRLYRKIWLDLLVDVICEDLSENMSKAFDEFKKRLNSGELIEELTAPLPE